MKMITIDQFVQQCKEELFNFSNHPTAKNPRKDIEVDLDRKTTFDDWMMLFKQFTLMNEKQK